MRTHNSDQLQSGIYEGFVLGQLRMLPDPELLKALSDRLDEEAVQTLRTRPPLRRVILGHEECSPCPCEYQVEGHVLPFASPRPETPCTMPSVLPRNGSEA